MDKDVKAGLICLIIISFNVISIFFIFNVSTSCNKDNKTINASLIIKSNSSSVTCNEQNDRLEMCLNELISTTRCDSIREKTENSKLLSYKCHTNIDCIGYEGYTQCINGYCSCKEKRSHPDQNWKYIKAYGECMVCPDDWGSDGLDTSQYCFKYFHEEKTFNDALKTCKSFDAELMTVDTANEWQAYQIYLGLYRLPHENVWLGYRKNTTLQISFLNVYSNEELENEDPRWCYDGPYRTLPDDINEICAVSGEKQCKDFLVTESCRRKNSFICLKKFPDRCKSDEYWRFKSCHKSKSIENSICSAKRHCNQDIGLVCLYKNCICKRGTKWMNEKCVSE